jgi:hypothetical protein
MHTFMNLFLKNTPKLSSLFDCSINTPLQNRNTGTPHLVNESIMVATHQSRDGDDVNE